jgi:hypothetical protein
VETRSRARLWGAFALVALALITVLTLLPAATPEVSANHDPARIRAVHGIPDFGPVDVYLGSTKLVGDISFFSVSEYLSVSPGHYRVRVIPAGDNVQHPRRLFVNIRADIRPGREYSIVASGSAIERNVRGTVLEDDNSAPTAGQVRLRVAHFSPDAPAVDIFINGERSPVQGLSFQNATGYLEVPPGTYQVGVAPAGGEPIFTTDLTLEAGTVYTAWANGLLAGSGATAFTVTPSIDAQYPTTFVRLLHAVPDAPAVDIFVDGDRVAAGVVFGDLSAFLPIDPGTYDVAVNVAGTDTSVISDTVTLEDGKRYTLAVIGRLADGPEGVSIALFEERRRSLTAGSSSLQVVNLAPDVASFDLVRNGAPLISALGFGAAGNTELPAGVHSVSMRMDNGTELGGTVTTTAEASATLFVVGLNGAAPESQRLRVIGDGNFSAPAQVGTFVVHLPLVIR